LICAVAPPSNYTDAALSVACAAAAAAAAAVAMMLCLL